MTFILRWPAILALLALSLISLLGAFAATAVVGHLPIDVSVALKSPESIQQLQRFSWVEIGLLYGAGLFFLISAVRLMRRTQGFWTWLLGFACFGGRWALDQQANGGLVNNVRNININAYLRPEQLLGSASPESQVAVLGIILIVGLLILIVDAADRAHWDRQAGGV